MQRILILGGGVGGTLTANLLVKKLRARIDRGEVEVMVVDATGQHVYQPGFMYIAMGGERAANLARPERSLLDKRVTLIVGDVVAGRRERRQVVTLADGLPLGYDQLVLATGSRIVPEAIEHFDTRGPPLLHARRLPLGCAPRSTGSTAAGSSSASPACPTSARRRRSRSRSSSRPSCASAGSASRATIDYCSPIGRAFTIESVSRDGDADPREQGHRAAHVLQRRDDRSRPQGRARASRARSCRTTC